MADATPPTSAPSPAPAPDAAPAPAPRPMPVPGPETNAVPLYAGSVSLWLGAKSILFGLFLELCGAALLVVWAVPFAGPPFGIVAMVAGFALIIASTLMLFYTVLAVRATRYTITHRHIEREMGLFVKKVDALPLGHVKRVDLKQSFIERLINVGTIEVFAETEDTKPHWLLEGIPNPRPTYEKLRDAVMDLTLRRGIILE